MGKWLDKVMDEGSEIEINFLDAPRDHTDKTDRMPDPLDRLTDEGKKVFKEYIAEMLSPKYGPTLTLEEAQHLAMEKVSCCPRNLRENIKE